jgi:hypothetical protein
MVHPQRRDSTSARDRISVEGSGPMIKELDLVALTRSVPDDKLEAGDVGTVVMVHEGGKGYTVEFMTLTGDTLGVVTLEAGDIRPIRDREIAHARAVA